MAVSPATLNIQTIPLETKVSVAPIAACVALLLQFFGEYPAKPLLLVLAFEIYFNDMFYFKGFDRTSNTSIGHVCKRLINTDVGVFT